jgi:Flp pilus assembly protein TadB
MSNKLPSEKVIVSAPTSFSGSAARIWKITDTDNNLLKWLVLVPTALMLVFMAWSFVAIWYFIIFGLFGIFVIPFRLLTRSGRNRKRNRLQHRELLAAVREERSANMGEKQANEEILTDDEIVTVILPTINNDGK